MQGTSPLVSDVRSRANTNEGKNTHPVIRTKLKSLRVLEAFGWLMLALIIRKTTSFKKLAQILRLKAVDAPVDSIPSSMDNILKHPHLLLGRYIDRLSLILLPEKPCLTASIAARMMLGCRGYTVELHLGVDTKNKYGKLAAHAWLICDGEIVTGRNTMHSFKSIAVFRNL